MVKTKYFKNPAVRPAFGRKTEPAPSIPTQVTLSGTALSWITALGLTSVVYFVPNGSTTVQVATITKGNSYTVTEKGKYHVTSFNRNNEESEKSIEVTY